MIAHIRFPGIETYESSTKDGDHLDELLTEDEIKELERREIKYQKQQRNVRKVSELKICENVQKKNGLEKL